MSNVILFTNWTAKRFAYPEDENAKWDGQPFSIEPGESKWLEDYKADKFARDIAVRELNQANKPLIPVVIDELKAKCFSKTIQIGASVSPAESIAAQTAAPTSGDNLTCDFPECGFKAKAPIGLASHKRAHQTPEPQAPETKPVEDNFEGLNDNGK